MAKILPIYGKALVNQPINGPYPSTKRYFESHSIISRNPVGVCSMGWDWDWWISCLLLDGTLWSIQLSITFCQTANSHQKYLFKLSLSFSQVQSKYFWMLQCQVRTIASLHAFLLNNDHWSRYQSVALISEAWQNKKLMTVQRNHNKCKVSQQECLKINFKIWIIYYFN